jgi:adenylate cyclase
MSDGPLAATDEPQDYIVLAEPNRAPRTVPIVDQLFVGRECAGIGESRRVVLADPEVSRTHVEIRLDAATDHAFVIDTSTNGTHLNGARLERAVSVPLKPGDEILLGEVVITFHSTRFGSIQAGDEGRTHTRISQSAMVMVVGDITNYSTISQVTDHKVVAENLNVLWRELGLVLRARRGTLSYYAGDALCAIWELRMLPDAEVLAVDFALTANQRVAEIGPELTLRGPDGSPIQMGWGVVQGMAALAPMTRSVDAVIGDATNVAFRLAGISGRNGRAPVMVTASVHAATKAHFRWGASEDVELKGRSGWETIYPALAPAHRVAAVTTTRVPTRRSKPSDGLDT